MKILMTVLSVVAVLATASLPAQDVGVMPDLKPAVYALQGATVHTVSGEVLEKGTVLIRDGLIEAVGAGLEVPPEARRLDLSGMHVYPGLIDALTENGLMREGREGDDSGRGQSADDGEGPGLYSYVHAADKLDQELSSKLSAWREAGVLTLHVAPADGIFMGQTAVVALNSSNDPDRMIIRSPVAMRMSFEGLSGRTYPGSLMGVIAHIKQTLLDARHYGQAQRTYGENPAGLRRPETDRALQALQPLVEGQMMAVFPAQRAREIRRVLHLAEEFGIKAAVTGGFEGARTAQELAQAGVPVLFSLDFPTQPRDQHPDAEESLAAIRYRVEAPRAAFQLVKAGVTVAFTSGGSRNARDFQEGLRKVVENGLSKEEALQAATLNAARILGVDQQLGSIEKGKIANLVVADGDLFAQETALKHVFVDGEKFDIASKPKRKTPQGDGQPVDFSGRWDVTVMAPDGNQQIEFDLQASSGALSGAVISPAMGSVDIYDGSYTGNEFSFKITVDMGMGPTEITLSGTASGNEIVGIADVSGLGTAPIEGSKIP